eukprot:m.47943 g.47943  ORF g.47943 m.47943 type:complete len:148 (+) comp20624_c1_seq2:273-716(+)
MAGFPTRIGIKLDPPALMLDYMTRLGDKRRRKMPINKFLKQQPKQKCDDVVNSLIERHSKYLSEVPRIQITRLVQRLLDDLKDASGVLDEDLCKLDEEELKHVKAEMDVDFQKNQKKPGDEGYEYSIQKAFQPIESSGWDESGSESD